MFRPLTYLAVILLGALAFSNVAWTNVAWCAITDPEVQLKEVGIAPMLGQHVDLDKDFLDENGQRVTLRSLATPNRPIIIVPAYYTCPRMCGLVLSGVANLLSQISLKLGNDFSVITVSFNPEDTAERAKTSGLKFRDKVLGSNSPFSADWHFLVGTKENSSALMQSLGFKYQPDGEEFSHTAAIFVLTPSGTISQFFAGIEFKPNDVRHGLVDASKGAIGSAIDQVFLFCFNYDHIAGKYVWAAFGIMRIGGILTLSFLGFLIYRLYQAEKSRKVTEALSSSPGAV